ncbi:MAG: TVP38/TMEM64 family protein [Acidobacteria bacterium]|nr:TVP38/TMEM64 family protein [Acidobacteriota bacterium]
MLGTFALLGRQAVEFAPRFVEWVDSLGPWGPLAFIGGYIVAAVAFAPGSLLSLAGGALFGLARGIVYVFIGGTLGAAAAFLVSRYVARTLVERRLAPSPRFAAIDRAVGAEGLKIVFLLRLCPIVPYNFLNYGLGLTTVTLRDYVIASTGMIPAITMYVYYGKVAGDVAALASGTAVPKGAAYYMLLILGLIATIVVTTIVARMARKAIRNAEDLE